MILEYIEIPIGHVRPFRYRNNLERLKFAIKQMQNAMDGSNAESDCALTADTATPTKSIMIDIDAEIAHVEKNVGRLRIERAFLERLREENCRYSRFGTRRKFKNSHEARAEKLIYGRHYAQVNKSKLTAYKKLQRQNPDIRKREAARRRERYQNDPEYRARVLIAKHKNRN